MNQYHLSWDSFKQNLCKGFSRFQQNQEFVDMTLAAGGHLVKVHKNLMALASPYIKDMLQSAPCQHPVLFLDGVNHEILSHLLEYIYTGEVQISLDKTSSFFNAAKALHITGLENIIPPLDITKTSRTDKGCFKGSQFMEHSNDPNPMFDTIRHNTNLDSPALLAGVDREFSLHEDEDLVELNINEPVVEKHFSLPVINENIKDSADITTSTKAYKETEMLINPEDQNKYIGMYNVELVKNNYGSNINIENDFDANDITNRKNNPKIEIRLHNCDKAINESAETVSIEPININNDITGETQTEDTSPINDLLIMKPLSSNDDSEISNNTNNQWKFPRLAIEDGNIRVSPGPSVNKSNPETPNYESVTTLYTTSTRGSLQLILNRFMYNLHHTSNGGKKRRWRCINYRKFGCKAYVDTVGEIVASRKFMHKHPFHNVEIIKKGRRSHIFTTISEVIAHRSEQDSKVDIVPIA